MKRQAWLIMVLIFMGCSNGGKDSEVLPKDEMSRLLWDMIQVDEYATLQLVKDTTKNVKRERIQLYEKVFQLHKTSEKQFSKSFNYYVSHPDILKVLFDSLEARGVKERSLNYTTKDSIPK